MGKATTRRPFVASIVVRSGERYFAAGLPECETKPGEAEQHHSPSRGTLETPTISLRICDPLEAASVRCFLGEFDSKGSISVVIQAGRSARDKNKTIAPDPGAWIEGYTS
jgi:hypothetical protein